MIVLPAILKQIQIMTDYLRETEHDNFIEYIRENKRLYKSHVYYNLMYYDMLNGGEVFFDDCNQICTSVEALNRLIESYEG